MKIFSFLLLIVLSIVGYTQENTGIIEDFEYLCNSIEKHSCTRDLYCKENNIKIQQVVDSLKTELKKNLSFKKFVEVSSYMFNLSGDRHNGFTFPDELSIVEYLSKDEREATFSMIDTAFLEKAQSSMNKVLVHSKLSNLNKIKTTFHNGKYYLTYDTYINEKKIPHNSIVLSINDEPINRFIDKNRHKYFMMYSNNPQMFYTEYPFSIFKDNYEKVKITFYNVKTKTSFDYLITEETKVDCKSNKILTLNYMNGVKYFKKYKTLYFKILFFDNTEEIRLQVGKYKNRKIDKIVFDIRDNGGGSDLEWIKLLETLSNNFMKNQIKIPYTLNKKNDYIDNLYFKNIPKIDSLSDSSYSVIYNDIFSYIKNNKAIIDYNGDFYCIMNNRSFSASLCFASLNNYFNNFYTVGDVSPHYGGFMTTPNYFMLPNSKLIYKLVTVFDYNLFNTTKRVVPNILIDVSLDEENKYWNKRFINFHSKRYLIHSNPYFKSIIME